MVKRYYVDKDADAHEHPDGYLVNYEDYASLEAECAELRKFKAAYDRLEINDAIQHKEPT